MLQTSRFRSIEPRQWCGFGSSKQTPQMVTSVIVARRSCYCCLLGLSIRTNRIPRPITPRAGWLTVVGVLLNAHLFRDLIFPNYQRLIGKPVSEVAPHQI